jgi:hypothetical protein
VTTLRLRTLLATMPAASKPALSSYVAGGLL